MATQIATLHSSGRFPMDVSAFTGPHREPMLQFDLLNAEEGYGQINRVDAATLYLALGKWLGFLCARCGESFGSVRLESLNPDHSGTAFLHSVCMDRDRTERDD